MTVQTEFRQILADDPDVAAIVAGRIYPLTLPANTTFPAATYFQVSGLPRGGMNGADLIMARWQVSAWGTTALTADALAGAIEHACNGYRGGYGDIQNVQLAGRFALYDPDALRYMVAVDLWIWHRIAAPAGG